MSIPTIIFYQSSPAHLYGGQLDMLRFFRAYDSNRLQARVLVPAEGAFTDQARALGIPITLMPLPAELARTGGALLHGSSWDRIRQLALLTPWSLKLARWLRSMQAQGLYANNRRAVLTLGPGAKLARIPLFWHIKQDLDRGRMDKLAMRLMTRAAGCSQDVQHAFQQRHPAYAGRIGYVPNGIPLAQFSAPGPTLRPNLGIPAEAPVIGLVGSLTPRKGVDLFVQAAHALHHDFPQAHFLLAGDAPAAYAAFKQQILRKAAPLQQTNHFHALGWLADMPTFYRTLDILAMPSRIEGFGLVVIEAAAAGVPTVRTATGGYTETTLPNKTGLIIPSNDANALTQALAQLLAHPQQRRQMGAAAKTYAFQNFDLPPFVQALTQALLATIA
jgi:hypothetical protein